MMHNLIKKFDLQNNKFTQSENNDLFICLLWRHKSRDFPEILCTCTIYDIPTIDKFSSFGFMQKCDFSGGPPAPHPFTRQASWNFILRVTWPPLRYIFSIFCKLIHIIFIRIVTSGMASNTIVANPSAFSGDSSA